MPKIVDLNLRYPAWGVCITAFLGLSLGARSDYGLVPIFAYGFWYVGCFAYAISHRRTCPSDDEPDEDPDRRESFAELIEIEELYRRKNTMSEAA